MSTIIQSNTITHILNGTLETLKILISVSVHKPSLITAPVWQTEIGVLIGITGDIKGRLILDGEKQAFASVGESMYGMALDGDMLDSFVGEFGNILAGNTAANVYKRGVVIDITPPTVMDGVVRISGFQRAIRVPVDVNGMNLNIVLAMEDA